MGILKAIEDEFNKKSHYSKTEDIVSNTKIVVKHIKKPLDVKLIIKLTKNLIDNTNSLVISKKLGEEYFIDAKDRFEILKSNKLILKNTKELEDEMYKIRDYLNIYIQKISSIEKKKDVKKIIGLTKPIIWEEIKIIHLGESLSIKQNNKLLGEYKLEDLGFPKIRKNKMSGIRQFFLSLFFTEEKEVNNILSSKDNKQQKIKSNLSKILGKAFGTNKEPIVIAKNKNYIPLFETSLGKELGINKHSSGKRFHDTDKPYMEEFAD